jgi:hypothetical protein
MSSTENRHSGVIQDVIANIDYYKSQIIEEKSKIDTLFELLLNEEKYETKLKDHLNKIEAKMRKCHELLMEMKEEVKKLKKNEPMLFMKYSNQMKDLQNDLTKVLSRFKSSKKMLDPSNLIQPSMSVSVTNKPIRPLQQQQRRPADTVAAKQQQVIELDAIEIIDEEEERRKRQEEMDLSIQMRNDQIANELFSEVDKIMTEQQKCVDRIKSTANHVMDLSRECLELEKQQQETIGRIQASLDDLEANLDSASSELKTYFKNLEKNNLVIVGTCVILGLIVLLILVALFGKKAFESIISNKKSSKPVTGTNSTQILYELFTDL